jgi:hypothetical protein
MPAQHPEAIIARLNTRPIAPHGYTHEGAPAASMTAEQALRRSVMSCLLWENEFYEDGEEIAARIGRLGAELPAETVASIAIDARERGNLRHVPLLLASILARTARGKTIIANTIARVVQRADELTELLAIHAKLNKVGPKAIKKAIPAQMKKGLARAFTKFDAYQLAKYDRDGAIRLRDALFMVHAKPKDDEQAALWKQLVANELTAPDTWEVSLSGGADKRETFERLIAAGKLGYLALLRNLRNMAQNGVDEDLVKRAIIARKGAHRVLPFRYVAAARAAPQFEPALDQALCEAVAEMPILPGKTAVMVDVSGSMDDRLSAKSDLTRRDAAAALASIVHGDVRMFAFADDVTEVPARRGMAGVDAINRVPHGGTRLFDAIEVVNRTVKYDRLIVITDEQAFGQTRHGTMFERSNIAACPDPTALGYMINVASAQRGVGYGRWTHIDGFSESILRFVHEAEAK